MTINDTFYLGYCSKVKFKLKRIDKTTKIHTFQHDNGKEFQRKHTEVDEKVNDWKICENTPQTETS